MKLNKYEIAIMRFVCDFSLELRGKFNISENIKNGNKELLNDIDILRELDFMIRNKQAKIEVINNE